MNYCFTSSLYLHNRCAGKHRPANAGYGGHSVAVVFAAPGYGKKVATKTNDGSKPTAANGGNGPEAQPTYRRKNLTAMPVSTAAGNQTLICGSQSICLMSSRVQPPATLPGQAAFEQSRFINYTSVHANSKTQNGATSTPRAFASRSILYVPVTIGPVATITVIQAPFTPRVPFTFVR